MRKLRNISLILLAVIAFSCQTEETVIPQQEADLQQKVIVQSNSVDLTEAQIFEIISKLDGTDQSRISQLHCSNSVAGRYANFVGGTLGYSLWEEQANGDLVRVGYTHFPESATSWCYPPIQ